MEENEAKTKTNNYYSLGDLQKKSKSPEKRETPEQQSSTPPNGPNGETEKCIKRVDSKREIKQIALAKKLPRSNSNPSILPVQTVQNPAEQPKSIERKLSVGLMKCAIGDGSGLTGVSLSESPHAKAAAEAAKVSRTRSKLQEAIRIGENV